MGDLSKVADVDIDPSGVFKYILIKVSIVEVTGKNSDESKLIVRGFGRCEYHADIFKETKAAIGKSGDYALKCLGGGRIRHEPQARTLLVYGYSQGFGRADHQKAVDVLKKSYADYASITFSNDGY